MVFATGLVLVIVCAVIWAVDKALGIRRELRIARAEDSHADAKKIVEERTPNELVDDFNKRYPGDGS